MNVCLGLYSSLWGSQLLYHEDSGGVLWRGLDAREQSFLLQQALKRNAQTQSGARDADAREDMFYDLVDAKIKSSQNSKALETAQ